MEMTSTDQGGTSLDSRSIMDYGSPEPQQQRRVGNVRKLLRHTAFRLFRLGRAALRTKGRKAEVKLHPSGRPLESRC